MITPKKKRKKKEKLRSVCIVRRVHGSKTCSTIIFFLFFHEIRDSKTAFKAIGRNEVHL